VSSLIITTNKLLSLTNNTVVCVCVCIYIYIYLFIYIYIKVKFSRYRPGVAQREGRGIALLFVDRGTSEWSAARPGRTLPPGKTRYPL